MLTTSLAWRHRFAPLAGSAIALALLAAGRLIDLTDVAETLRLLWRPALTITSVMLMSACAQYLGLFDALAALIEPATRGPVRRAFGRVFALSAVTSAVLSNDAAILVLTPTVIALLRAVYPRRHPTFTLPFSFAVFYSAGVAPLVTGNPMNVVVAGHAGIGFNQYAVVMIPVALIGALVAYPLLARQFATELSDEAPALGEWPQRQRAVRSSAVVVVLTLAVVLVAYPVISYLEGPLWAVASAGAVVSITTALADKGPLRRRPPTVATLRFLTRETTWELLPFLAAVLLVARGFSAAGVVDSLVGILAETPAPLATMGGLSAVGAAAINNHPMAMIGALAVERLHSPQGTYLTLAGLIGGDLGPRLLPIGSLAGLLWFGILRHHGIELSVLRFVRIGLVVTLPSLVASLGALWLLAWLGV